MGEGREIRHQVTDRAESAQTVASRKMLDDTRVTAPLTSGKAADQNPQYNTADLYKNAQQNTSVDQRIQTITDANAKPEDRLAAAQQLAKDGVKKLDLQNDKGEKYSLNFNTSKAGARELVSIHQERAGEREKPLLKGVANSDGSFEQQKNSQGKFVDWRGSAKELGTPGTTQALNGEAPPRVHSRHLRTGEKPDSQNPEARSVQEVKPIQEVKQVPEIKTLPVTKTVPEGKTVPEVKITTPADSQQPYAKGEVKPEPQPEGKLKPNPEGQPDAKVSDKGAVENPALATKAAPISSEAQRLMDRAAELAFAPAGKLVSTEHGLYMRAKMAVDADGSPRAKQIDPRYGQTRTSMRYDDPKAKYVNAEEVPYVVLPRGQYQPHGVQVGDMALVRNKENGKMAVAVFGDVGPKTKRGEGSMALARDLGLNPSPKHGGTQENKIEYLAFPKTRGERPKNQEELLSRISAMEKRLGISR